MNQTPLGRRPTEGTFPHPPRSCKRALRLVTPSPLTARDRFWRQLEAYQLGHLAMLRALLEHADDATTRDCAIGLVDHAARALKLAREHLAARGAR